MISILSNNLINMDYYQKITNTMKTHNAVTGTSDLEIEVRASSLERTYNLLQEWDESFARIHEVSNTLMKLKEQNSIAAKFLGLLLPTDDRVLADTLELESHAKANRSYLLSRIEDKEGELLNAQIALENKIAKNHKPRRIHFGRKNDYEYMLREEFKDACKYESVWSNDNTLFAIELPLSLPDAYERLLDSEFGGWGGKSWEETFGGSDHQFPGVSRQELRNLDKLTEAHQKVGGYWSSRHTLPRKPNIIKAACRSITHSRDYSALFALKEGNEWTTHYVANNRIPILRAVGTLLGKNIEQYKPFYDRRK